ncbi:cyclin-dependent kinase 4 inhibitor C [Polymixia lowei]
MAEGSQTDKLCSASANGDLRGVLSLLDNGADVNGYNIFGRTSLQVVRLSCPDVAVALLEAGADPNVRDPVHSLTITHDAARDGFLDLVRVLVEHGADANLLDDRGNLPLHLAAEEGRLEVVRFLIGRTVNPGRRNTQGRSPYDVALICHRMDTAQYIAEYLGLNVSVA